MFESVLRGLSVSRAEELLDSFESLVNEGIGTVLLRRMTLATNKGNAQTVKAVVCKMFLSADVYTQESSYAAQRLLRNHAYDAMAVLNSMLARIHQARYVLRNQITW